jgi:cob(I)alamin adenosyltransferase
MKHQLELFTTAEQKVAEKQPIKSENSTKATAVPNLENLTSNIQKQTPPLDTFIVHSAHLEVWADVSPRTAQREMRKIRKSFKMRDRAKVTFIEVADYYGWRGDRLLKELNHRKLTIIEKIKEKI